MTLDDVMSLWISKEESDKPVVDQEAHGHENPSYDSGSSIIVNTEVLQEIEDGAQETEVAMPDLKSYRRLVVGDPAYGSLLANVRRECILAPQEPNLMEMIKNRILSHLRLSPKVSRHRPAKSCQMTFVVEWDPIAFLLSQNYLEKPEDAIEKVITVTGSVTDAQALTCRQYLCQTWPSTGTEIMQVIKDVLRSARSEESCQHSCKYGAYT